MSQLSFTWPAPASYAPEDFIVTAANKEAWDLVGRWPGGGAGLISGPEASGKTHLARCWQARTGALCIDADDLGDAPSAALFKNHTHALLEDIHLIGNEPALFHLLRHAETFGAGLLFTSRAGAAELPFSLPDLRSRLLALPSAAISAPDEELLKGFLFKCFSDRQLRASDETMDYVLRRAERSFHAVRILVMAIEKRALDTGRAVTIPLIKSLFR